MRNEVRKTIHGGEGKKGAREKGKDEEKGKKITENRKIHFFCGREKNGENIK